MSPPAVPELYHKQDQVPAEEEGGGVSEKKKRSGQAGREGGLSPGGERRELAEYR